MTSKPKLFWLIAACATFSVLIGGLGVALVAITGSKDVQLAAFTLMVLSWVVGVSAAAAYVARQASGAYKELRPRKLRDQMW